MTRLLHALPRIAAAVAAAILIAGSATAHSGEWGIFPDSAQAWPGAGLHMRGDLPSTGPIELVIVGPGPTTAQLGTIEDAPNGHFETTVTVPAGLAPGSWSVQARAAGMVTAQAPLDLVAPPPPGEGDEEAEPYPSGVPRASIGPRFGDPGVTGTTAVEDPLALGDSDLVPLAAAGLAIAGLAVLLRRTRRPDPSR